MATKETEIFKRVSPEAEHILRKDEILRNLKDNELHLASTLRNLNENNNHTEDLNILEHMGAIYYLRGLITKLATDFAKASALYNASLIRTQEKSKIDTLRILITTNEKAFYQSLSIPETKPLPTTFTHVFKEQLNSFREDIEKRLEEVWQSTITDFSVHCYTQSRIEKESILIEQVKSLSGYTSKEIKLVFKDILNECYNILGPAPQKFAIVGLGSLAREEMTPYSDLEFVILVEDDKKSKTYFRNLTHLLHLFVINLGETLLPSLGIDSLNDFNKERGDWFYDSVTVNGISFDGAMPWACKTPTGRPDREYKAGVELIKSPASMAKHTEYEWALKEGYHLADVLRTATLIDGCSGLLEDFNTLCSSLGNDSDIKCSGLSRLKDDVRRFGENMLFDKFINPLSGETFQSIVSLQEVKKQIYRIPSLTANNFKLIFNLNGNTPWDLLDEMQGHILSDEDSRNLQVAVSVAVLLRLKTYMSNKGQKESISYLKQLQDDKQHDQTEIKEYFCNNKQIIFRFYFTVVPLLKVLSSDYATRSIGDLSYLIKNLYDDSYRIQGHVHSLFLSYKDAAECYVTALTSESKLSLQEKACLQGDASTAYYEVGDYDNALHWRKQSLPIWENVEGGADGVGVALNGMGKIYYQKGDSITALECYYKALNVENGMTNRQRNIAALLVNIATILEEKGDYNAALSQQLRALQIKKNVFGEKQCADVAISLNNVGSVYKSLEDYDNALSYFEQALQMKKQVYGTGAHPTVANTLMNIASAHQELNDLDNALLSYEKALQMYRKIYVDGPHPLVAQSLSGIASVYASLHDYKKALSHHQEALQMRKKIYGSSHAKVADSLYAIAEVYVAIHDNKQALSYNQEALQMRKKMFGSSHDKVADSLYAIAEVYVAIHDDKKALSYNQEALQMRIQIYGKSNAKVAESFNSTGELYRNLKDNDNAFSHHKEALQIRKQIYGTSNHLDVAVSLNNVALVYQATSKYEDALSYHLESLQMRQELCGSTGHLSVAFSLNNIAYLYNTLKNYNKALLFHLEALRMFKEGHGADAHPDTTKSLSNVALTYYMLQDYNNAMSYQIQSVVMHKELGSRLPSDVVAHALLFLAKLYKLRGDTENMNKYKQEANDIMTPVNPQWLVESIRKYGLSE